METRQNKPATVRRQPGRYKDPATSALVSFLIAGALLCLFFLSLPLWADDKPCKGHSCNEGVDVLVNSTLSGGDNTSSNSVSIGGSRAYGFGGSNFDVDIAQCLATKADNFAFGLWGRQRVQQNLHCMGLAYMQAGMFDAAKHVLCDVKHAPLAEMPDCPGAFVSTQNRDEDTYIGDQLEEQHAEQIQAQQAMITDLQAQVQDLVQTKPAKPVTVVRRESFLDDAKRAKLRDLIDE